MITRKSILALLAFISTFGVANHSLAQSDGGVYFATDPAISPDGQTIVFSYETDLWKVPAKGGAAVRLTGMDGKESSPGFSPDGKWLAFSSTQYGNSDIYVMPVDGGKIRRLTYHQASDEVESWTWDSRHIYFRSDRYNRISVYKVALEGGTPIRLFGNYQNTIHDVVQNPKTGELYFNESWESFIFPQRKRYKGPFNPDIKSYNPETKVFKKYTSWVGKDFWPTVDRNGNLYFVSDEANNEYNLYTLKEGKKQQLTNFETSVKHPNISANGQTIAFEKEYQIYTYNVASGKAHKVPIAIYHNNTLAKEQSYNVQGNISAFDVSPDGKKLAFVSRGELFVSNIKGKFVHEIDTHSPGRVLEVKWLDDNKTLIFNQTVNGYQNWFVTTADGSESMKQLTNKNDNNRMLALNSDRTKGVYLSGRNELRLINLKTYERTTLVTDEFWGYENQQPRFSPDDRYIVYTAKRDFESDMFAYNLDTKQSINLTKTGVSESDPFWSPDGKYLYFSSSRVHPSYPRGGRETDLYRMALKKWEKPYESEEYDKLFKEKNDSSKTEDDTSKTVKVEIDETDLMQRLEQIGASFGSQWNPYVIKESGKTMVFYLSDHDQGKTKLWVTTLQPFKDEETKQVEGIDQYITDLTEVDGSLYGISGGTVYSINPSNGKASKINPSHAFNRNFQAEFNQMFKEMWANIEENYYNENLNNVDWEAIRDRYAKYLPHIHSRADFRLMMNDMLGELNSSHIGFYTAGKEESEYYSTMTISTGLIFESDHPYRVKHVVIDGPADVAGKDIRPGDRLIAVDGRSVDTDGNREAYFSRPELPEELALTFRRGDETRTVKIHPEFYFNTRLELYDEWEDKNQERVDRETDKRVAYVHMKNMAGGELKRFLEQMTSETYHRDALILDLRYNTGGNVHNAVLQFLSQRPYAKWKYRSGKFASQPNFVPSAKPIILLVNEQSLSDAEVTAAGFKELGLGTIVGTETYHWIIFTSGKSLVDGSFYRLPSWGVYRLDGRNIEHTGVEPDIPVDNNFKDRLTGKDPQLERAIREAMKQLNSK